MKKSKSKGNTQSPVEGTIKLGDIESGLRSLKSDMTTVKDSATGAGLAAGLGIALLILLVAFVLGRARGQKKYAFIDIRRA